MKCLLCGSEVNPERMPVHVDNNHMRDPGMTIAKMLVELARIQEQLELLVGTVSRVQQGGESTWQEKLKQMTD